ncbi:hypothetical protein L6452_03988 [Arctium lappa]|uniref:Uncharacterized protein n=1 Tax=Arctium lappa TaxID=4217 RepID=A0ACB9FN64_ARCLA|nr:hypothetical protein L6452_03988 [Arctium lappa]
MEFMADHHRDTDSNFATGFSNFLIDQANNLGFSGNHIAPPELKINMDSTRILGAEIIDTNQDHKRRCFEKLLVRTERTTEENVEDVKCSLQVEVIDDTALIEATAAVSGFKTCYKKNETDNGYRNKAPIGGSKKIKQENDGKKRRNKGSKKVGRTCSTKCVNETKFNGQTVEGQGATEKKISEGKGQKMLRKMGGKVKVVYQRKDTKGLKLVPTGLEEHQNVPKKIINGVFPESETVNLKASNGIEQESTIELVETQTVNQIDDGLNPKIGIDVHTEKIEEKDQDACENTSKKMVYSREELEALRFVGEEEQTQKWTEVYSGLSPSVAKEYTSLLVDTDNRQPQRYNNRVANCGSTRHAILSMPPVLPLCSSSNDRKFAPYGRGFRVNFH